MKIEMCRMYTVFDVSVENIQYYFTEFNVVQKLDTYKEGQLFLDKIKSGLQYRKKKYTLYNLIIFIHFCL